MGEDGEISGRAAGTAGCSGEYFGKGRCPRTVMERDDKTQYSIQQHSEAQSQSRKQ